MHIVGVAKDQSEDQNHNVIQLISEQGRVAVDANATDANAPDANAQDANAPDANAQAENTRCIRLHPCSSVSPFLFLYASKISISKSQKSAYHVKTEVFYYVRNFI